MTPIPRRPANIHIERKVIEPLMLLSTRIVLDPLRFLSSADAEVYKAVKELLFDHLEAFDLDEYWVVCDRKLNRNPKMIVAEMRIRYNPGEPVVSYSVVIHLGRS